jgi:hypothetical protein
MEQHLRRVLKQLDLLAQIGSMALDLAADLRPIAQQHAPNPATSSSRA